MLVLLGNELILNSLIYAHWNIISMTSPVNCQANNNNRQTFCISTTKWCFLNGERSGLRGAIT